MSPSPLHYLQHGNPRQQAAYTLLTQHRVFDILAPYHPELVGTIPLAIDLPHSDLDIICHTPDLQAFHATLITHFAQAPHFHIRETTLRGQATLIANCHLHPFELEFFGQAIPTRQQLAYRHMVIERRLLAQYGQAFRQEIIALKSQGIKTEPAFAQVLGLQGDPYLALLELE